MILNLNSTLVPLMSYKLGNKGLAASYFRTEVMSNNTEVIIYFCSNFRLIMHYLIINKLIINVSGLQSFIQQLIYRFPCFFQVTFTTSYFITKLLLF